MDTIEIKDLIVYGKHGVLSEEKALGQKFMITVEIHTDLQRAGLTDDLYKSINYAEICELIAKQMESEVCDLIETVAEHIAYGILSKYPSAMEVSVYVKKPSAPIPMMFEHMAVKITRKRHIAYIGMGSNMGDKKAHLDFAVEQLEKDSYCHVAKISDYITTAPVGYTEQDDFLNAVVKLETFYEPEDLLDCLQAIEQGAKRERLIHWGPRTLDLDVLLYDTEVIQTERLRVPHPEMHKRMFVLEPLRQIAPYAIHPLSGKYINDLAEALESCN